MNLLNLVYNILDEEYPSQLYIKELEWVIENYSKEQIQSVLDTLVIIGKVKVRQVQKQSEPLYSRTKLIDKDLFNNKELKLIKGD